MSSSLSAKILVPYAEALMSVAQANNLIDRIGEDVASLLNLLKESPELQQFLSSPVVKAEDKKAVLGRIAGEQLHPYMRNFLNLLKR